MTDTPRAIPESEREPGKRYTPEGFEVPAPSENDVLYEVREGVAWITFNRPLVLNAVDWSLTLRFGQALERAEADESAKVVVVRGAGRAFCAGGDLQAAPRPDDIPAPNMVDNVMRIWQMQKPVIASVRGYAVGQGCEIAGMCDLTIAAEDAKFGEIQIRHGFPPPILIVPFLTGPKGAKEILMTGEVFGAQDAQRLGLVNRIVPTDALDAETEALAKRLVSLPQTALALTKMLVNRVHEIGGFREGFNYRDDPVLSALAASTRDDKVAAERLATLREQGWDAFKKTRDASHT
ncbi:MAG: enoyl-CoA hydratase/isomerase family protein [Dehalococcoidia bacterium]|nr:enoyl-CoA hydratase/isomerase family protein [Dehalococcoidia bacterium]